MNTNTSNALQSKHIQPLSLLVFGAGAIGTYIGGALLASGHRIVFLERPPFADLLRQKGLHWQSEQQRLHFTEPLVTDNLSQALQMGPFNASIFALKSYDTPTALNELRSFQPQLPPIISFQNGVENEDLLRTVYPAQNVIAGVVASAIGRLDIGSIIVEKQRGLALADTHSISAKIGAALTNSGFNFWLCANEKDLKWSKLLTNLLANASCAILDMNPIEVLTHRQVYRLEIEQLRETLRVMRALGIKTQNLPATPVRALAAAIQFLPPRLSQPLLSRIAGAGRGAKMPSFHIDLYSKKGKTEVDALNGAVVRQAQLLSIPTPVNRLLNDTLHGITQGSLDPQQFLHNPEALYSLWKTQT